MFHVGSRQRRSASDDHGWAPDVMARDRESAETWNDAVWVRERESSESGKTVVDVY